VWDAKQVKARKTHMCCECLRTIERGETYEQVSSLYDGRWSRFKTCKHCLIAREFLEVECDSYTARDVLEELREHYSEELIYRTMWLARAIIGMRRGWKKADGTLMSLPKEYPKSRLDSNSMATLG